MTWIQTFSGRRFDLAAPRADQVDLDDIAFALGKISRFTGHTVVPYSVAQHCLVVASLTPPALRLAALMHDAAEAYVGDMSTPLKAMIPEFKRIELGVEAAIRDKFSIADLDDPLVKRADLIALFWERRDLMGPGVHGQRWAGEAEYAPLVPDERLQAVSWATASRLWLAEVKEELART